MAQSYKIFVNQCMLHLVPTDSATLKEVPKNKVFYGKTNLRRALDACNTPGKGTVYLAGTPDGLMQELKTHYQEVKAAGGIVLNPSRAILFIKRHGTWDLPKGKTEPGEDNETAARREVEEECGIQDLQVNRFVDTTYHTYQFERTPVLKTTYWYEMEVPKPGETTPQTEEGITEVKWVRPEEILPCLNDTYPNIRLLLETFLKEKKL